jgi:hypothetical protein
MAYSKLRLVLNNRYVLEQDIRWCDHCQAIYKAREINRMLKLGLRKMGATPRFARRQILPNGKKVWNHKTRIELI